jgi:hypothetical protein
VNTDFKFALRTLRKSPSFTAIALLTLALGIGANATVFSVLEAILLRPLPIDGPGQVFFLETTSGGLTQSVPDYRDLKTRLTTFSDLAGYRISPMALQSDAGAERVWGYLATGNYFDLLGVRPALGRLFAAARWSAGSLAGRSPQLRQLATAIRRRSLDRRPRGSHQQSSLHSAWRRPERLSRH